AARALPERIARSACGADELDVGHRAQRRELGLPGRRVARHHEYSDPPHRALRAEDHRHGHGDRASGKSRGGPRAIPDVACRAARGDRGAARSGVRRPDRYGSARTRPTRIAYRTRLATSWIPSRIMSCARCVSTVLTLSFKSYAISLVDRPSAMRRRISTWRGVRRADTWSFAPAAASAERATGRETPGLR